MSPESALADLRIRAEAAGAAPQAGGSPDLARLELERDLLVAWARERKLAFDAREYLDRIEATHGEHHVFYDPDRGRYFKITHGQETSEPGFALTVGTEFHFGRKTQRSIGVPWLREATPFEYLTRLQLFNRTFHDDVEVEGVITDAGNEAIVISQAFIEGDPASSGQVAAYMNELGFTIVPGVTAGRGNSTSFYRAVDSVAVFDTHGQNFLVSGNAVTPIDGLIVVANADLDAYLRMAPEERAAEIRLR